MREGMYISYGKPGKSCGIAALVVVAAISVVAVTATEECDTMKCKGPLRFYEDLKCKPVYDKPGDCCAVRYDCSHLNGRSTDKCYVNGKEYAIGERLRNEDRASPCDVGCFCSKGHKDIATFICAVVDCPFFPPPQKEGCYFKRDEDSCCSTLHCPKDGEKIVVDPFECVVDGKTYKAGQSFYPSGYPEKSCVCQEGYKGENVAPFCKEISCGTEMRRLVELRENCAPVYYSSQSPRTSCSYSFRCQNGNDTVIPTENQYPSGKCTVGKEDSDNMKCKFGNMTMSIGEELNQGTDYSSVCVKCVCEVPPAPTCQRLPDDQCDVTVHPKFD